MSQLFTEIMKDDQIKRAVLVKFGFGNVNKSKVNNWVKEQFPTRFAEIKKNLPPKKIVKFASNETEMTSRKERDAFLDNVTDVLTEIGNNMKKNLTFTNSQLWLLAEKGDIKEGDSFYSLSNGSTIVWDGDMFYDLDVCIEEGEISHALFELGDTWSFMEGVDANT
ncbi:hypothetical protein [Bacillus norwichensis]|uniref:Phage protein n=1 Tax=Bacillus norwichensis TaxID=2762217 RepID=A0ABR8VIG0_9BACI|nr:hypothetical protein [Bacillus norwichensis]MBD8004553.1 hypothetical protein [Bacillus norwichensis]